jgi:peptidoglycan/LPS O-acetylase OafA/YrhL
MKFELIGSMLVFLALFLFRYIRSAYGVLAIASFALLLLPLPSRNLACFFVGMIFAKMRADGWWDRIQGHRFSASSWLLILPVAFIDGISNRNFAGQGNKPLYAMILIAAVFANKPLCGFFSSGLSQFLGKVSFPLYLLQFPVLISLTSWMILSLSTDGHLSVEAVWLIAAVTVAVCLLASVMFWPIEKLTKWTEDAVTKLVFSSWDRLAAIIAQGKYQ